MTEEKKEMTNEEPIILTFDDVEYRASDLNVDQQMIAVELNEIVPELQRLEKSHAKLNRFKNYLIQDFQRSLTVETPEEVVVDNPEQNPNKPEESK
tara:strand:+ start:289 stop:576 length:288 start_codon:yes stop_codon:yes gene_type:complete